MTKTIEEKRVRVEFNPSNQGVIDEIKQKTAVLINIMPDETTFKDPGEVKAYTAERK